MERPEELDSLAEDWITLWQSEIAGLAADPELAEQWAAWAALGAAWMRAAAAMAPRHGAEPHDRAAPPPWSPPPATPSGPSGPAGAGRDDEPSRDAMARRLAELERRLADLEGGSRGAGADPGRTRRRGPRA